MKLAAVIGLLFSLLSLGGCAGAQPPPTPDIKATVEAAVEATVEAALPNVTPGATPDIAATVQAQVEATIAAVPTHTPRPIPTPTTSPTATPTRTPSTSTPTVSQTMEGRTIKQYGAAPLMTINPDARYTAKLTTNKGDINIELFASEAPITVNNFVFLSREDFYDGVIFHRVIKGFMIQTGDPRGNGTGGPGYRFQDEPVSRSYTKGIVAMANAGPDTNGSQFFIVHGDNVNLPPSFTIFGQVSTGLDTVDQIANAPVQPSARGEVSSPTESLFIVSIDITEGR